MKRERALGAGDALPERQGDSCQGAISGSYAIDTRGRKINRGDTPVRSVCLTTARAVTCEGPAAPSRGVVLTPAECARSGGCDNLVWHTTVVAGAMARLSGAVSGTLAPAGTDQAAWSTEVGKLVHAVSSTEGGVELAAPDLLLEILGELNMLALPLTRAVDHVPMPLALLRALVKARATATKAGTASGRPIPL